MKKERYPYIGNPYGFELPKSKPVIHPTITKWEDFSEEDKIALHNVKNIIQSYIGNCRIAIFGSRIKGNWDDESDYDIRVYAVPNIEIQNKLLYYKYDIPAEIHFTSSKEKVDTEIKIN
jgi:predicted nucleotidyltransferase